MSVSSPTLLRLFFLTTLAILALSAHAVRAAACTSPPEPCNPDAPPWHVNSGLT
jgi:hypothetical protein